jgi:exodeoxyribonuclease VII large subunit
MPELAPTHNSPEFSVSEISNALKRMVETNFSHVRVRGEISGYRGPHSSGHCYFGLKDDKAKMDAVIWKGGFSKLSFKPEEGMEVIATGKLTTFPGTSKYQIVIEQMEIAGVGALMALLEKRKKMLAAEGLFDPTRKKSLPFLPTTIGVITSPTGAVIRDILHRLSDRSPCHVLLWPVAVQGEGAAAQIAHAINGFNSLIPNTQCPIPDLLIVARGGGSIEDLWAFNEEIVVRAAAASRIPLISAVGHETDTTLIDYAADRRAPTPTAAAEMAVPVRADLLYTMRDHQQRMDVALRQKLERTDQQLTGLARGLPKPLDILHQAEQKLDNWSERLQSSLLTFADKKAAQLQHLSALLRPAPLLQKVERQLADTTQLVHRLGAIRIVLERKEQQLGSLARQLDLLDFHQVLKRGFALVKDSKGTLITSAETAKTTTNLTLTFHDGDAPVTSAKQGSLF